MRAPMTVAPAVGCGAAGPKSGAHPARRHLRRQPFELAAADVLEIPARRIRGGLLVEIDRHAESRRPPRRRRRAPAPRSRPSSRPRSGRTARRRRRRGADVRPGACVDPRRPARARRGRARPLQPGRRHRPASAPTGCARHPTRRRAGARRALSATAAAIAATTSGRRPSLMLGMHSMMAMGPSITSIRNSRPVVESPKSLRRSCVWPIIGRVHSLAPDARDV